MKMPTFVAGAALSLALGFCPVAALAGSPASDAGKALPEPFVRLSDVAPSIAQDMRYAGSANFIGAPLDGYAAPVCILTRATALALDRAQRGLAARRPELSLQVLDCYRPLRAVAQMVRYVEAGGGDGPGRFHHPSVDRRALITQGYISARSSHALGIAVDLQIIRRSSEVTPAAALDRPCTEPTGGAALDFGTTFDCFDEKAGAMSAGLKADQRANRLLLREVMTEAGFSAYAREWWHFNLPFGAGEMQDFPVTR